ncbi:MAG: radical SAM protein, partial [Bacteroidota bacterium]
MKKIRSNNQHYDAWLHWDVTKRCNLNCEYCFGKITDPKVVVNLIDIEKLIATLDKTDKVFRISFTGGEPTMVPNFVEALNAITEKHFISFNTNLITKNLTKIIDAVDPQRILHIHASLHYDELVKKNLLERFIENFKLFKKNGFNIFTEVVAYPPLVDRIYEMKSILESEGIDITFAPFFGKLNDKIYPDAYTEKELELFGISENELQCFSQK